MSVSESPLRIGTSPDAWITVADGRNRIVVRRERGSQTPSLPPGIYTIICEEAGRTALKHVRHGAGETKVAISAPPAATPAPIGGAVTSHEYYEGPAREWSNKASLPMFVNDPLPGWLFVFIRPLDHEHYTPGTDLGRGFTLVDSEDRKLVDFADPSSTFRDLGWGGAVACSCPIDSGFYRLQFQGEQPREMPVRVFPGWSTQVFVMRQPEPLFRAVRIFLREYGAPFEPYDEMPKAVDSALAGLETGIADAGMALPAWRVRDLLAGKFQNPMFGLVGAYWLVLQGEAERPYVEIVLGNLNGLLPGSADVIALRAAAAQRFGMPMPAEMAAEPPLILAGTHILRRNGLIAPGSFFESIAADILEDAPWTTWRLDDQKRSSEWLQIAVLEAIAADREGDLQLEKVSRDLGLPESVVLAGQSALRERVMRSDPPIPIRSGATTGLESVRVAATEDWVERAAVVMNAPFRRGRRISISLATTSGGPIVFDGVGGPVRFHSIAGQGGCRVFAGEQGPMSDALDRGDPLTFDIPSEPRRRWLLLRWDYERAAAPGRLGLGARGPAIEPRQSRFAIMQRFPQSLGARDVLEQALAQWRIFPQLQSAENLEYSTTLFADVVGSLRVTFEAWPWLLLTSVRRIGLRVATGMAARVELEASGQFRLAVGRESKDSRLRVRVLRASGAGEPVSSVRVRSEATAGRIASAAAGLYGLHPFEGLDSTGFEDRWQAIPWRLKAGLLEICARRSQEIGELREYLERIEKEGFLPARMGGITDFWTDAAGLDPSAALEDRQLAAKSAARASLALLTDEKASRFLANVQLGFRAMVEGHFNLPAELRDILAGLRQSEPPLLAAIQAELERWYSRRLAALLQSGRDPLLDLDISTDSPFGKAALEAAMRGEFDLTHVQFELSRKSDLATEFSRYPTVNVWATGDRPNSVRRAGGRIMLFDADQQTTPGAMARVEREIATQAARIYEAPERVVVSFWATEPEAKAAALQLRLRPVFERFVGRDQVKPEWGEDWAGNAGLLQVDIAWALELLRAWNATAGVDDRQLARVIRREMRLWIPFVGLDVDNAAAMLGYGALQIELDQPPENDLRARSQWLNRLLPALQDWNHAHPESFRTSSDATEALEKTDGLGRELLNAERGVIEVCTTAMLRGDADIERLMSELLRNLPARALNSAPTGSQMIVAEMLIASVARLLTGATSAFEASVRVEIFASGVQFPPDGFPMHAEPAIDELRAQKTFANLVEVPLAGGARAAGAH